MDIEKVASDSPEKIITNKIDFLKRKALIKKKLKKLISVFKI